MNNLYDAFVRRCVVCGAKTNPKRRHGRFVPKTLVTCSEKCHQKNTSRKIDAVSPLIIYKKINYYRALQHRYLMLRISKFTHFEELIGEEKC